MFGLPQDLKIHLVEDDHLLDDDSSPEILARMDEFVRARVGEMIRGYSQLCRRRVNFLQILGQLKMTKMKLILCGS